MLEIGQKEDAICLGAAVPEEGGSVSQDPVGASFGTGTSVGTRIGDAANYSFSPGTALTPGQNDFRKYRPEYQTVGVLFEKDTNGLFTKRIAEEGSSLYDRLHFDREYTGARVEQFLQFRYRITRNTDGNATYETHYKPRSGFAIHPAFLMGGQISKRIYVTKYKLCNDGAGGVTSVPGAYFKTNTSQATFQTLCRNVGMIVMPKHVWDMVALLAIIQYNNYSVQAAIGQGQTSAYREAAVTVAQESTASVIVANSHAPYFSTVRNMYFSGGWYKILGQEAYDESNIRILLDRAVTTTTSSKVYAGFNWTGYSDEILSKDGEHTTMDASGRRTSVVMGLEDFFGGPNCGLACMCRINANESLVSPDPVNKYEWPTASDNKGWEAGPAMLTADGYPGRFAANSEVNGKPWLFVSANNNGNASAPTGDRTYANAQTDPKMCYAGGAWDAGANAGLFCAGWDNAVSLTYWSIGARGVLNPLLVG